MKKITVTLLLCLMPVFVYAQPSPTGVGGIFSHGSTQTITGSTFGTKTPAAPLLWDDCESSTADTAPSGVSNSYSQVGYSDFKPVAIRDGEAVPATHRMLYREFPYTPYGESGNLTEISAPHSHSTKCLSGGHYYLETMDGSNPARDVQITVPTAAGIGKFCYPLVCSLEI